MLIPEIDLKKLYSKDPKIKYGFVKELLKMGKESPELLYDYMNEWRKLLKSENNILKWTAIDIIGYVSAVDKDNKDNKVKARIKDLLVFLHGGNLISCNHAIFSLGLIAQNKPEYQKKIIKEFLLISEDKFDSPECQNIAIGKVVLEFQNIIDLIKENKKVLRFIRQAQQNTRNATKKKADKLMKKIEKLR